MSDYFLNCSKRLLEKNLFLQTLYVLILHQSIPCPKFDPIKVVLGYIQSIFISMTLSYQNYYTSYHTIYNKCYSNQNSIEDLNTVGNFSLRTFSAFYIESDLKLIFTLVSHQMIYKNVTFVDLYLNQASSTIDFIVINLKSFIWNKTDFCYNSSSFQI